MSSRRRVLLAPVALALVVLLVPRWPAEAATTLSFEVRAENGGVAVAVVGGDALLRIRDADPGRARRIGEVIAERLAREAARGTGAAAIVSRKANDGYAVYAGSELLCTASAAAAKAAGTTAQALAPQWAANLRRVFAGPYLTVDAPNLLPLDTPTSFAVRGQPASQAVTVAAAAGLDATVSGSEATVVGRRLGAAQVVLARGAARLTLPFEVRLPAGRIAPRVNVTITGRETPRFLAGAAIRSELLAASEIQTGAALELQLPPGWKVPDAPGRSSFTVGARLSGGDTVPVEAKVAVELAAQPWADQPADRLYVSNNPEKVADSRLLLRGALPTGARTRLLYHHKTVAAFPLVYEVRVVNPGDAVARVHVRDAGFGPNRDEMYVGHLACVAYWRQRLAGQGAVLAVPPRTTWTLQSLPTPPEQVTSGLSELTVLAGEGVEVHFVSTPGRPALGPRPLSVVSEPFDEEDLYLQPLKTLSAIHRPGGMFAFLSVGREPVQSAAGTPLLGNYGVEYLIDLGFENTASDEQRFELAFCADGGVARGAVLIDGQLFETGLVRPFHQERLLDLTLPPGASRRYRLRFMPQSGSNYPLRLVGRPYTRGWSGRGKP